MSLGSITAPSPTGTGVSQSQWWYEPNSGLMWYITDANGNTHTYNYLNGSTQVIITNALGNLVYVYTVGYDPNMSGTTRTDGACTITQQPPPPGGTAPPPTYTNTHVILEYVYGDSHDP